MPHLARATGLAVASVVAAGGLWTLTGCASGCETTGDPRSSVARLDRALAADVPVTVTLTLPDELRSVMTQPSPDRSLRLAIQGVAQPNDAALRVFVDRPDADASTPVSDPHYAGSFTFFPRGQDAGEGANFLLDLKRVLARLRDAGHRIGATTQVTLVLVPLRKGGSLAGVSVRVDCVSISIA